LVAIEEDDQSGNGGTGSANEISTPRCFRVRQAFKGKYETNGSD
jgi:hypothetical protein